MAMRQARWVAEWRSLEGQPVLYHCCSRVVDKMRVLGADEKDHFRELMRLSEQFSGCRVLAYCLMDDHVHLLVEVPPHPSRGLTDDELLRRLRVLYPAATVDTVARELEEVRWKLAEGLCDSTDVARIHSRYLGRMHDLGQFMKGVLQRYTQWHNGRHGRRGTLWENRYRSVIVEEGIAATAMAAYIDLNPVRANLVSDPGQYAWSSYGEACGAANRGDERAARAALVRAIHGCGDSGEAERLWNEGVGNEYRQLFETEESPMANPGGPDAREQSISRIGAMLRKRVRHFSQGAVIGSKDFVNSAFEHSRERFGPKRKDGARKMRGAGKDAEGILWSLRDLRPD